MENIRTFHAATIGVSHIKKNMPCQDAAGSYEDHDKGIYIGVVSDGHGSKDYFRSDRGSKLLVEASIDILKAFAHEVQDTLFQEDFVTRNTLTFLQKQISSEDSLSSSVSFIRKKNEEALNHLFKTIITRWHEAIEKDWNEEIPTEEHMREKGVSESMLKQYMNNNNILIAYGCTLLAFLKIPDYWFAFQLGDGKCIAFDDRLTPFLPIPEDEQCIGNITTSMCQADAFENFRFAYGKKIIKALFVGSDGLDGRHGDMEDYAIPRLIKDYTAIIKTFLNHGFDSGYQMLKEALPIWSNNDNNAKDDMSVAGWIDFSDKENDLKILLTQEKNEIKKKLEEAQKRIEAEEKELKDYNDKIAAKEQEMKSIAEKDDFVKATFNASRSNQEELELKLIEEKNKQAQLGAEQDVLIKQKEKLEIELNELRRVRENKSNKIKMTGNEIEKTKVTLQKFGSEIEDVSDGQ